MKIKVNYSILYKNGKEDNIIQEITDNNVEKIAKMNRVIEEGIRENLSGVLKFGDGEKEGYFVRIDDISRVKTTVIVED